MRVQLPSGAAEADALRDCHLAPGPLRPQRPARLGLPAGRGAGAAGVPGPGAAGRPGLGRGERGGGGRRLTG